MTKSAERLLLYAVLALCPLAAFDAARAGAAKPSCTVRSANGTGASSKAARFQAYESLLQATGWSVWAAWMADGSTPGYKIKPAKYTCQTGTSLGVTCRGQATICKL